MVWGGELMVIGKWKKENGQKFKGSEV